LKERDIVEVRNLRNGKEEYGKGRGVRGVMSCVSERRTGSLRVCVE
jgi:hypothetical protein